MIARRGFLAGCLAMLASPLALFRKPRWQDYADVYVPVSRDDVIDAVVESGREREGWVKMAELHAYCESQPDRDFPGIEWCLNADVAGRQG